MAENQELNSNLNNGSIDVTGDSEANYIDTIKELKKNSVKKSEYDKLLEENKKLLETLVNGDEIKAKEPQVVMSDKELKDLINKTTRDTTNLEYITTMLAIRKEMMAKGLEDPMAPKVVNHTNDERDYEKAQRVADFLQDCVDEANGDNETFKALFQAGLQDPKIPVKKNK